MHELQYSFFLFSVQAKMQEKAFYTEKRGVHTVLIEISPLDIKELIRNSKAARSPILESIARSNKFLAVSIGFFLIYIVTNALSTASYIDLSWENTCNN